VLQNALLKRVPWLVVGNLVEVVAVVAQAQAQALPNSVADVLNPLMVVYL